MDQRCGYISNRKNTKTGPLAEFDPVLRERYVTLYKLATDSIYALIAVVMKHECSAELNSGELTKVDFDEKLKGMLKMDATSQRGNLAVLNKAKEILRAALTLEDLGPVKVSPKACMTVSLCKA